MLYLKVWRNYIVKQKINKLTAIKTQQTKQQTQKKGRRSHFRQNVPSAATVQVLVSVTMDLPLVHCGGSECWLAR